MTTNEVRLLRRRVGELEDEVQRLVAERAKFRDHFAMRFKWWIKLLASKEHPNLAWLIEDDARWMTKFSWWSW